MRSLITFIVTLLMPIVLITGGGMVAGWGLTNDWDIISYTGIGMTCAGVVWGLFLWLWASDGGL